MTDTNTHPFGTDRFIKFVWPVLALCATVSIMVLSQYPALWLGHDAVAGPVVLGIYGTFLLIWRYGSNVLTELGTTR